MDGSSFIYSQTDTVSDLRGNTKIFPMNTPVICEHFRITCLTTTSSNRALFFNSFDCFCCQSLIKRDRCTWNCNQAKRSQIALILIFFLPSSFTSWASFTFYFNLFDCFCSIELIKVTSDNSKYYSNQSKSTQYKYYFSLSCYILYIVNLTYLIKYHISFQNNHKKCITTIYFTWPSSPKTWFFIIIF